MLSQEQDGVLSGLGVEDPLVLEVLDLEDRFGVASLKFYFLIFGPDVHLDIFHIIIDIFR